jgi:hypothetical protein
MLAFVGTVLLLLLGFVWYPLKRAFRYLREKQKSRDDGATQEDEIGNRRGK